MRSRRVRRSAAVLGALAIATLLLVSVETGSETRVTRTRPPSGSIGLTLQNADWRGAPWAAPTSAPAGPGAAATGGDGTPGGPVPATTDPAGTAAASTGPDATGPANRADSTLGLTPYRFRLGLINGTVVKPDAQDWAARTVSDGPLLLFLPATGHVPNNYDAFLTTAAEAGYHVLGLDFFNRGKAVASICGTDSSCYTQVQRNRLTGGAPNRFSKIDAANGVVSRLHAALAYLEKHDPQGGWGQYATADSISWNRIVVAGHSQGGGEASYIAHEHEVKGQLTFASPIITDVDTKASWLDDPSKTPASRMYAFDSANDLFFPRIEKSWQELGLTGPIVTKALPVPTSREPHRLVTTLPLGNGNQSHLRVVTDGTPLDAEGSPVFEPIWKWMLAQLYVDPQSPASIEKKAETTVESQNGSSAK